MQWKLALAVLADMHGFPDSACFSAALTACEHDMEAACILDEIACTLGTSMCHKAGEWRNALAVFDGLIKKQVSPGEANFGAALMACADGGAWVCADQLPTPLGNDLALKLRMNYSRNSVTAGNPSTPALMQGSWQVQSRRYPTGTRFLQEFPFPMSPGEGA
ncbi:unnamed protein product, partial [Symbiodinium necroappetens]